MLVGLRGIRLSSSIMPLKVSWSLNRQNFMKVCVLNCANVGIILFLNISFHFCFSKIIILENWGNYEIHYNYNLHSIYFHCTGWRGLWGWQLWIFKYFLSEKANIKLGKLYFDINYKKNAISTLSLFQLYKKKCIIVFQQQIVLNSFLYLH